MYERYSKSCSANIEGSFSALEMMTPPSMIVDSLLARLSLLADFAKGVCNSDPWLFRVFCSTESGFEPATYALRISHEKCNA